MKKSIPIAFKIVAWNVVSAILIDGTWVEEVFVEVVNELKDVPLHRS